MSSHWTTATSFKIIASVIGVEHETDFDALRQKAMLLDKENDRLHGYLRRLARENARLRGDDSLAEQLYLDLLQKIEKDLEKADEESDTPVSDGDSEDSPSESEDQPEKPKRRGHGPKPQPALPVQTILFELEEAERVCDQCGSICSSMTDQFESSEVINVVRRQFVVEVQNRQKYRCQCHGKILTAPLPPKLVAGGRYSIEFGIEVAVAKYMDHLPLERQTAQMNRQGLDVSSQTLWDQINLLSGFLRPSFDRLWQLQMEEPVLGVDETRWPLLVGGIANHSVLGTSSPRISAYKILPSKSEKDIGLALTGHTGVKVADGYKVYENLTRAGPGETVQLANCWAHVYRKFEAAKNDQPTELDEVLRLIGELFKIERRIRPFPGNEEDQNRRREFRKHESSAIIQEIKEWAVSMSLRTLPRSRVGKAVKYMEKRWTALEMFLTDPRIPADNNGVERALRSLVVGRKNHYGSKSRQGTKVASILYSLCETCKINGVDPHDYLLAATLRAIRKEGPPLTPLDLLEAAEPVN